MNRSTKFNRDNVRVAIPRVLYEELAKKHHGKQPNLVIQRLIRNDLKGKDTEGLVGCLLFTLFRPATSGML